MKVQIIKNAPITINGCKCVINAELVTLRRVVIDVLVSKRRGQSVKSNWKTAYPLDECPKDYARFYKVIDTNILPEYADGYDIYQYVKHNFTCEKYVNLTNPNASKELLIILS